MRKMRRLALIGFVLFVVVSAALHFMLGSAIATWFPRWEYQALPDQAISIISLSRQVREEPPPPTPTPTAEPQIKKRTATHIAPLKFREITAFQTTHIGTIHAPARRKSNLFIVGPKRPKPGSLEAPAASNAVEPTPSPGPAGARQDTGGVADDVNASVWGDDNPPRVLHSAAITIAAVPARPVRIAVEVGPDGNVISVRLIESSGDPALDQTALDAARKTVFAPATLNGLPVHGSVVLEYPAPTGST